MPAGREAYPPGELNLQYAVLDKYNTAGLPGQALLSDGPNQTPYWGDVAPPMAPLTGGWEIGSHEGVQNPPLTKAVAFDVIQSKLNVQGILAIVIVTTAQGRGMFTVNAVRRNAATADVDFDVYSEQYSGIKPPVVDVDVIVVGASLAVRLICDQDVTEVRARYQEI